jgi:hypothetical protein
MLESFSRNSVVNHIEYIPRCFLFVDLHEVEDPASFRFAIDPQRWMEEWYHPSLQSLPFPGGQIAVYYH